MTTHSQTTVAEQPVQSGSALVQVSGALTVIILLILLVAWLAKRFGLVAKHTKAQGLAIISSISLGGRERLVLVEVDGARLVLGVTSQQIRCLHTLPPADPDNDSPLEPHPPQLVTFSGLLKTLMKRNRSQ